MAKRFTDTEKWRKVWFRKLKPEHKCFWEYLRDTCNHAGIWEIDFELAEIFIGAKLDRQKIEKVFEKQFVLTDNKKKWFIRNFVDFQYGELNPENRAHNSVIHILKKEGAYKGLIRGFQARKDMDKDIDKDMVIDKDKDWYKEIKVDFKGIDVDKELEKMYLWLKDNPRKNLKKTFRNWLINCKERQEAKYGKDKRNSKEAGQYAGLEEEINV